MINVLVAIKENAEQFQQFINSHKKNGVKFYVAISQKFAKSFSVEGVELHVFADNVSREEMINSLSSSKLKKGKILIVRRPLEDEEFERLCDSQADIASLKAKHNKFVSAFKKLTRKIIKKIFAFEYFEDISAICFGEDMFELLSVCSNLSTASRINKFVGVSIEEIETANKPVKKEYNHIANFAWLALGTAVLAGAVAGAVCWCLFAPKLHALMVILSICMIFVALIVQFVAIINFARTLAVGKLRFGRAEEIVIKTNKTKKENVL